MVGKAIQIGGTSMTSGTTTIYGGTGTSALSLQAASSGTILVATVNSNTVKIGSTSGGSTINIGQATSGSDTITLANGATSGTNSINIGNGAITCTSS